jgi:hypothetical protein
VPGAQAAESALLDDCGDLGRPGPAGGAEHELLITHNFVIGWFVREALGGPLRPAT